MIKVWNFGPILLTKCFQNVSKQKIGIGNSCAVFWCGSCWKIPKWYLMSKSFSQYYVVYVMHSWVKMMVLELDLEVYEVRVMDFPLFLEYISRHHAMDAVVFLQRFFSREISFDFWLIILKAANTYYICQVLQFQQKKKSSFYLLLVPKKGL